MQNNRRIVEIPKYVHLTRFVCQLRFFKLGDGIKRCVSKSQCAKKYLKPSRLLGRGKEYPESTHSEAVDDAVGNKQCRVYTNGLASCGRVACLDSSSCRYQICQTKGDPSSHGELTYQIKPRLYQYRSFATVLWSVANQPVTHEKNGSFPGGAKVAAQKYGPPLVGIADTISAILRATKKANNDQ